MLLHDCKRNKGPSHAPFVQAHKSVGMPGLSYKPTEFTKDHALPLRLRPQSAAPHHLALCSQLVAPRRAGGTLSAAAAGAKWERRLCCQGPLPQACWAAGAGHVPDTSSPIVPQPTLTSRGISPRGRTAAARRRRRDSGHATGCAAQSRRGNTAAGATPAGAALPCVPPGSSLVPPAPLLTKLAGTQVLHDGLRLHLVVTRGTHSCSWQEKRRGGEEPAALEGDTRSGSLPQGPSPTGQQLLGSRATRHSRDTGSPRQRPRAAARSWRTALAGRGVFGARRSAGQRLAAGDGPQPADLPSRACQGGQQEDGSQGRPLRGSVPQPGRAEHQHGSAQAPRDAGDRPWRGPCLLPCPRAAPGPPEPSEQGHLFWFWPS